METNEIATKADLLQMKHDLLSALSDYSTRLHAGTKEYLKSNEVMELLGLSSSGLQNLRIRGQIPFAKIGGQYYYNYYEIQKILSNAQNNPD